ncbi:MAG: hypothetical protein HBSIN02_02830 [Bacteroidia bacterium]|nr:MAG: hypothetical protein HBSIN02_02830 [Bacteroidia bacterium]
MSFKLRNTIVLGVFFLLVSGGGFVYWFFIQPKQLDTAVADIRRLERELQQLPDLIEQVKNLTAQYHDLKRKYDSRSKEIPTSDITSQTYAYMSRGIDQAGFLKFNMTYTGAREFTNWGINAYLLQDGEAEFDKLYKFVYYMENGKRLYKIHALNLIQQERIDEKTGETKKWVAFSMEVHAYYSKIPELATSLAAKSLGISRAPFNPFNPLILQTISNTAPPGVINADNVEVKAVLPGKAFVLFGNELQVLHLGDRVWRGYVSRIVPQESKVVFTLDEGGIVRRVEKQIQFGEKQTR